MSFLERLERDAGAPGLIDILSRRLSPTDLQSVLLEVYRQRTNDLTPSEVLRRYKESRFSRPSPICPAALAAVRATAFDSLKVDFSLLQLSPLAPVGTCSALATCDQNKIVSTVRNLEVAADPTNALALEAALRRRREEEVHLAAVQRVVRAQYFDNAEDTYAHFELLGLLSSARRGRDFLLRHLRALLNFLGRFPEGLGELSVRLTPLDRRGESAADELLQQLPQDFPHCRVVLDRERTTGRGYYQKVCYKLFAGEIEVGDGGYTDWTSQLLNNRKEQCLIGGIGLDRLAARV